MAKPLESGECLYPTIVIERLQMNVFATTSIEDRLEPGCDPPGFSRGMLVQEPRSHWLPDQPLIDSRLQRLNGQFHFWCDDETTQVLNRHRRWVSIASSRLTGALKRSDDWFDALRTLGVQLQHTGSLLLTAKKTTTDRAIRELANLFQLDLIEFCPLRRLPNETVQRWEQRAQREQLKSKNGLPRLFGTPIDIDQGSKGGNKIKPNDRVLIQAADEVILLSVRRGGNIFRAVQTRLASTLNTRLLINRQLTPATLQQTLLEQGATGWWLPASSTQTHRQAPPAPHRAQTLKQIPYADICQRKFLIHWTRPRSGPWPDQTESEYLRELLFRSPSRGHAAIDSLNRILESQRLLGTAELTRDTTPVVCFSHLTLATLSQQKVFRPHLNRWDFLPYGIAFDTQWLEHQSARPVIYADEHHWNELPPADRPFYQRHSAESRVDWRIEQEWRATGDLDLRQVPADAAIVFVGQADDLPNISPACRWPVVVMPE